MIETTMQVAVWAVNIYVYCILFYVISSWVPSLRENIVGRFVSAIVKPYLDLFRFIPPIGMIDISPVIAILAFDYLSKFLLLGIQQALTYIF